MIPEPMSEAVGRARIHPASAVEAGARGRWTVTYEVGEVPLGPGSLVRFTVPYGFTAPNFLWVTHPGYCYLECSRDDAGVRFVLPEPVEGATHNAYMTRWGAHLFVEVARATLSAGDTVSLIYGHNPFYPQMGAWAPYFTQLFTWWVAVKPAGTPPATVGKFLLVAEPPTVAVKPGPMVKAGAVVPSIVGPGEVLEARPFGEDAFRNRIVPLAVPGSLALARLGGPSAGGRVPTKRARKSLASAVTMRAKVTGDIEVLVRTQGLDGPGHSNPMLVRKERPEYRLYWGDIHGHSIQSDGLGTVAEYYRYGREEALLDFCSIADHVGHMDAADWERAQAAAEAANDPDRFVTFAGYELNDEAGEKCIYYRETRQPIYRYPADKQALFALARAGDALIIPHQHGRGPWPYPKDVVRVTEIYSVWGAFEEASALLGRAPRREPHPGLVLRGRRQQAKGSGAPPGNPRPCIGGGDYAGRTVLDMLLAGYRPGVIGGSDCHAGHPGHSDWLRHTRAYWCGLAAVYARELTREAVWEALLARRCYATTGPRIIVSLRARDAWMGAEVPIGARPGPAERKVKAETDGERVFDIEVVGTAPLKRVTLIKNGRRSLSWRAAARSGRPTGGLASPTTSRPKRAEGSCFILPGEGQVLRTRVSDASATHTPAFYYLRVEQEDGEMAWSSPIWFVHQGHV
jgi:hypothetical protein